MPNLAAIAAKGCRGMSNSVIPSFTNPNNIAIATGAPPDINGICGNYYYDQVTGDEVMMNDPKYLRCPTIFSVFAGAGGKVGVVTAKEKLRRLLGKDLQGVCFSVERANEATLSENGIEDVAGKVGRGAPDIYDPEISVYCIEAGVRLLELGRADLLYLSTTDFVQHKYKPGSREAESFYSRVDKFIGQLDRLGVIIGITADHGMNDKTNPDGSPKVQFLEDLLRQAGFSGMRVILPITDPYVVHHGALGSYATIYMKDGSAGEGRRYLEMLPGVDLVLDRASAAARFHLPPDRIGDLVVFSDRDTTLGRTPDWHDLSVVEKGLRSHGGLHEQRVPFILNRRLSPEYAMRLASGRTNNYDLFDFAFNGTQD
jgi:phosphonoacetate hydrolase